MKKYLLFLGIIGLFALTACGKQAKMSDVTIDYGSSSIYSKENMDAAIKAIKLYSWILTAVNCTVFPTVQMSNATPPIILPG